jgi:hypothetical protein
MLLHQPAPDAITNIEVESREQTACAGAEAIVVPPSPQDPLLASPIFTLDRENPGLRRSRMMRYPTARWCCYL